MASKLIIGLCGPIASGKGEVSQYLQEKYQAIIYSFSNVLRHVLQQLYLPLTRPNLQNLSSALRQTFDQDLLAKIIAQDISADSSQLIVVEGIRRLADIDYIKRLPGFVLVKVEAAEKLRYQRLLNRGQNSDDIKKTFEQFLQDQQAEAECGIPLIISQANYTLNNDGDLKALQLQIDKFINNF